ncbi:hypothetical protein [Paenibacillus beijingensis]|uniref:Lipoprotein n=1 Tax=Paenibacillus beijingensis TaxID=1126833 RepID=A0A0D5NFW4_9BACL|nr:hypothetical protein [Paenibacillus beijingensis]AJY74040.1 hypothetical protein VN24_04750 [Paenibacillus beijingensis]
MKKSLLTLMAICLVIVGCQTVSSTHEKILSSAQILDLFEKPGIQLTEPTGLHPENVFLRTLNEVSPQAFTINEGQLISIYVYPSSREAKKGIKDFEEKTAAASVVPHNRYQVANVLLFYVTEGSPDDKRIELVVEEMRSLTNLN